MIFNFFRSNDIWYLMPWLKIVEILTRKNGNVASPFLHLGVFFHIFCNYDIWFLNQWHKNVGILTLKSDNVASPLLYLGLFFIFLHKNMDF